MKFVHEGFVERNVIEALIFSEENSLIYKTVSTNPELVGIFRAPYLNSSWSPAQRTRMLVAALNCIENIGHPFDFHPSHRIELMRLDDVMESTSLVLEKSTWFHREGVLVLSLFRGNARLMSLSFAIIDEKAERIAQIGAIQGRNVDGVTQIYKDLTKSMHGLRPRDFLLDALRLILSHVGVQRILAVTDACRHHRHKFFGLDPKRALHTNYDEIWMDRGGVLVDGGFFELPLHPERRDLELVNSKKRSMYRTRYQLLDSIANSIPDAMINSIAKYYPDAE